MASTKVVITRWTSGHRHDMPDTATMQLTVEPREGPAKGVTVKTGTAEDQSGGGEHAADKTEDESGRDVARERTADEEAGVASKGNNQGDLATIIPSETGTRQ